MLQRVTAVNELSTYYRVLVDLDRVLWSCWSYCDVVSPICHGRRDVEVPERNGTICTSSDDRKGIVKCKVACVRAEVEDLCQAAGRVPTVTQ